VTPSILLIDDKEKLLADLVSALSTQLAPDEAEIRTWTPRGEEDPEAAFEARIDNGTALVVTDYDLTGQGQTGLFGLSIVAWCQAKAVPVGDFSRKLKGLSKEPNLFELRIPSDVERAAPFIASIYRGFRTLTEALAEHSDLIDKKRSPAGVLAEILGVAEAESQFALYGLRLGTGNAALVDKIMRTAPKETEPTKDEKRSLLSYIVGHLLVNAVLRFPGPILSTRSLVAYVGSNISETEAILGLFTDAAYSGPFSQLDKFFWLSKIDAILDEWAKTLPADFKAETIGGFNRAILEVQMKRELTRHDCHRCGGENGGFICPFTGKTVCQRSDCSVGSNSWIPQGAKLCRIERDFYEEWAPILGI
jgi:hypothetical protein